MKRVRDTANGRKDLGRYNVHIEIYYKDGLNEEHNVKSWTHAGNYLALDLDGPMLKVVNLEATKYFIICPQAVIQ